MCRFCNTSTRFELFVPEVSAKLQLLSNSSLDSITAAVQVCFSVICFPCTFLLKVPCHWIYFGLLALKSEYALMLQISSQHPNEKPPKRADGYWRGYITRAGESTAMQVRYSLLQVRL